MSSRFFIEPAIQGDRASLTGNEAHHLIHVMRAAVGDEVVLFDGSGTEFTATVEKTARSQVDLLIISRQEIDCELPFPLTLGVALPKGDRQKWLIEKATELGVGRIVPLLTQRGVAQPGDRALERLERVVVEASKQCGRNRLMQIASPQSFADFAASVSPDSIRLLAHPTGETLAGKVSGAAAVYLAIGPEGGFTSAEIAAADTAGWQTVSLGPRILRIETAAVALAAQFSTP